MLDEVANFYDSEIDVRLNTITTFIEPVILVFMGSLVMTILLAMYLPLFYMIGNMGQRPGGPDGNWRSKCLKESNKTAVNRRLTTRRSRPLARRRR